MQIIDQSATILTPADGHEALRRIEYAGRACYRSHDRARLNTAPAFVRSLIQRGHLSPLEFADMAVE